MAKPSVYLETTVVSYLVGWLSRNSLLVASNQELTREWWTTRRNKFELFASTAVVDEARKGEGKLAADAKRFRLVVVGDADFASNSFFPYLSNADLVLAAIGWLLGEERAPTMKPPVEVLPTVTLTGDQVRGIFLVTVLLMPGLLVLAGIAMWWVRR